MCNSRDFRQGNGWGHPLCHFLSADTAGPGLALHIQPVCNSDGIYLFIFYINKGADKTGGAQAGLGICCSMFQRHISRDNVPTIFKNFK